MLPKETYFKYKNQTRLKVSDANTSQNKAGVATVISKSTSEQLVFLVIKNVDFIIIKTLVNQEDIILNVYSSYNKA